MLQHTVHQRELVYLNVEIASFSFPGGNTVELTYTKCILHQRVTIANIQSALIMCQTHGSVSSI